MTSTPVGQLTVIVTDALPLYPSPGEDGRRIVRHGLADVLAWLGEEPGPAPGAPTHMIQESPGRLLMSRELWQQLYEGPAAARAEREKLEALRGVSPA